MKRSNILIISFIIFILSGMLVLFIFTKNYEKNHDIDPASKNFKTEEIGLPAFKVIVAEPDTKFNIISGDFNKLIISDLIQSEKKPLPYVIINDTLRVIEKFNISNNYNNRTLTIYCSNVKTIVAGNNSEINIDNFDSDSLTILADKGMVLFGFDDDGYDNPTLSNIKNLTLIAKNKSTITIHEMNIENAIIKTKNSEILIQSANKINKMSAKLSDSSKLNNFDKDCKEIEMDIKTDKSSKINFFSSY